MAGPLPVTLVGGFLGAGKTSLLHHLISEGSGGHLAVLVEGTGQLGFDTKALRGLCGAMQREFDVVEEFASDVELAEALRSIAQTARHERVLVEVSGLTSPAYWARLISASKGAIELEATVIVVDLLDFHRAFVAKTGTENLALSDFQRELIAGAGVLVLNKCDLAGDAERQAATHTLRAMNPQARIIETDYGEVPPAEIFRPTALNLPAETSGVTLPELESVVFRAFKPFHPQRFWVWFNAPHSGLLRVKGIIWLATRNLLVGGVSRAGLQNGCGAAGIWWAALPREEWPDDAQRLMEMQDVWREPYGDRRQELVLIGTKGSTGDAARKLNLCLLSPEESAKDWKELPDPFPAWDLEEEA